MPEKSRFAPRSLLLKLLLSLLVVLTVTAILLPIEIRYLWRWGVELAGHPVALVGIVLVMAALMRLGLPGSLCFWLIAPFHAPLLSVSMVSARQAEQAMDFFTLLPLIILALLLALGGLAKRCLLGQAKVDSLPPG